MTQTLTAPPVRPTTTSAVAHDAPRRASFRDRLQARRVRNAPMARQILAQPATRGVGGGLTR